jgi:hypothetical protein
MHQRVDQYRIPYSNNNNNLVIIMEGAMYIGPHRLIYNEFFTNDPAEIPDSSLDTGG